MLDKIQLAREKILGNHLKGMKQEYIINYMPQIEGYIDKIELAIITGEKEAYKSIRFSTPEQLESFMLKTILAYIYFCKKRKQVYLQNYEYIRNKVMVKVDRNIHAGMLYRT